ncbi:MAG: PIN domain-containing protein [Eubacteriales bacterium]|nr:PIN domain-containing protein [Eubacteriales bacterium]
MKYYAVIDTNVLVSALLRWESPPGTVAAESLTGRITPLLNTEILAEYRDVLNRPKFHFPKGAIDVLLNGIIKRGIFIDAEPIEEELPDPKDIVFYQVVMNARKTESAYLVTGNIRHFPVKSFVVTPREMIEIVNSNET